MVKYHKSRSAFGQAPTLSPVSSSCTSDRALANTYINRTENHERAFVLVVPEKPPAATTAPAPTRPGQASSSSKAKAAAVETAPAPEPEMLEYLLTDTVQSQKLARQKFLYMEDRRRYEFNGTSKRRGRHHPVSEDSEL